MNPSSSVHILQHQCNHSCQGSLTSFHVYFSFNFFPCFHSVGCFLFYFFFKGPKLKPVLQFCGQIHCNNRPPCLDIIMNTAEIRDLHQDLEVWCCFVFLTESKFQIIISLIQGSSSALHSQMCSALLLWGQQSAPSNRFGKVSGGAQAWTGRFEDAQQGGMVVEGHTSPLGSCTFRGEAPWWSSSCSIRGEASV